MTVLRTLAGEQLQSVFEKVEWVPVEPGERGHGKPGLGDGSFFATHRGIVTLGGVHLRCYQLNDGQRVFDLDDVEAMLLGAGGAS